MANASTRLPPVVHRCLRQAEGTLRSAGAAGQPVLLGVSGGSDSMALLEIVSMLAQPLELAMHVACIDHGLRPEAKAELEMVRSAASTRGAVFHGRAIDPGRADEDSLRRARHQALREIAASAGCRFILLGHTADDQIETMLMRFLRGAGPGGLSGMRALREPLLRPLLELRRNDLRELLQLRGVAWAEDPGNESPRYARGRLRTAVLPAIEQAFGRGAIDHLLDVAPRWRADEDYLEAEAERLLAYAQRRGELDIEAMRSFAAPLRSRALRAWIRTSTGHTTTSRELDGIERWLEGDQQGGIDFAAGRIERHADRLVVRQADRLVVRHPARPLIRRSARLAVLPSGSGDRSGDLGGDLASSDPDTNGQVHVGDVDIPASSDDRNEAARRVRSARR